MQVAIRADASYQIGSGHVMRCLALARALHDLGGIVVFISRNLPGNLNRLIEENGFRLISLQAPDFPVYGNSRNEYQSWLGVPQISDAHDVIKAVAQLRFDWVIVDHYAIDYRWENEIRVISKKVMVIDDLEDRCHACDLLLDQNYSVKVNRYQRLLAYDAIRFLGSEFSLLRSEFSKKRIKMCKEKVNRLFVFFGGIDRENVTGFVLSALLKYGSDRFDVDVVIGDNNPNKDEIESIVRKYQRASLYVQIDYIGELMSHADLAIGGGGGAVWERMAVGLPSIVITIAENQIKGVRDLDTDGYINWFGSYADIDGKQFFDELVKISDDHDLLVQQSEKCSQLVDGRGAVKVADFLINGLSDYSLDVRRAELEDELLYWNWANDDRVRKESFNSDLISWSDHQRWFHQQLDAPDIIMFVVDSPFGSVGQVRFKRCEGDEYYIGYSVAREYRGMGLGKVVLRLCIEALPLQAPYVLIGDVKNNNVQSRKIFSGLGFEEIFSAEKIRYRYCV